MIESSTRNSLLSCFCAFINADENNSFGIVMILSTVRKKREKTGKQLVSSNAFYS
jgi:hypothetical protein